MKDKYRKTLLACYLGFITQAIAANFAPLLFLTFKRTYGIPISEIAFISTTFFFTQLLIDLFCAKFVDKIGYRKSVVASEIFSAAGLIGLAVEAARGLEYGLFQIVSVTYLLEVGGSQFGVLFAHGNARYLVCHVLLVVFATHCASRVSYLSSPILHRWPAARSSAMARARSSCVRYIPWRRIASSKSTWWASNSGPSTQVK